MTYGRKHCPDKTEDTHRQKNKTLRRYIPTLAAHDLDKTMMVVENVVGYSRNHIKKQRLGHERNHLVKTVEGVHKEEEAMAATNHTQRYEKKNRRRDERTP